MSLASRLKTLGLVAAMSAGLIAAAHAELPTLDFEASPPGHAAIRPWPAPTGHHRPHASGIPHDIRLDAVRNEEEFDRKFGMCRRC